MRILIVDDDVQVAKALGRMLSRQAYTTEIVASGREALETLDRFQPDLVLCDQRMPEMLGIEVLRQVKDRRPATVRILISGFTDEPIDGSITSGVLDHFVAKPWVDRELLELVRESLAGRAQDGVSSRRP